MILRVAGVLSLIAGAALLLLPPGGQVGAGLFAGLVVAAGGLVLLWLPGHLPSRRLTAVAMVVTGLAGTAAGLAVSSARLCCMFAYTETRGWPYAWAARSGVADTPAEAIRLAEAGGWGSIATGHLAASAVVWSYAGLVVIAVLSRVRGTRRE